MLTLYGKRQALDKSKLICGLGLIGWPGNQALGDTIGKLKIKKDMYMDFFERLLPLFGMFFPWFSHDFSSFRRTMFRAQGFLLDAC